MNGKPDSTIFDHFWNIFWCVLAVDERRHGDVMHMPLAIIIYP